MSGEYVITFHTHYDSLVCMRAVNKTDNAKTGELTAKLVPVPRSVSSSCGTALKLIFRNTLKQVNYIFNCLSVFYIHFLKLYSNLFKIKL